MTDVPITTDPEVAGRALAAGELVGLPTETVYGLAADAANPAAVEAIFSAKGRPHTSPLIVHVARHDQVADWACDVPAWVGPLLDACWPGPLTVVLPARASVPAAVVAGGSTVALRMPAHPLARAAIAASCTGVAAPSANVHGAVSPTRADHVSHAFDASVVAWVLDGGACSVGVESTIVDCTRAVPTILRSGAITAARIGELTGLDVAEHVEHLGVDELDRAATPAPGQARSHYAPRARVELVGSTDAALERAAAQRDAGEHVVLLLGDRELTALPEAVRSDVLVATTDDSAFARDLYAALRDADARGADRVIAVAPPTGPLADASRDRLTRAAAPRGS